MPGYKGTHTIEYDFSEVGENPMMTFVVEVDYTVTFGSPGFFNPITGDGEPPSGDEVEFDVPNMYLLAKDGTRHLVPQEIRDYFLRGWDGEKYVEAVLEEAHDGRESMRTRAAEMRAEKDGGI